MKMNKFAMVALSLAVMAGCKGGSDGGNGGGDNGGGGGVVETPASESYTRTVLERFVEMHNDEADYIFYDFTFPRTEDHLVAANDEYKCGASYCSLDGNPVAPDSLWRHEVSSEKLVPVYHAVIDGETEQRDERVLNGMKAIEDAIGRPVFEDKGFIHFSAEDVSDPTAINYADAAARGKGGLIMSVGTAQEYTETPTRSSATQCGTVAAAPYISGAPNQIIDSRGVIQSDKGWAWINLGNDTCGFDSDIVAHEASHYLFVIGGMSGDNNSDHDLNGHFNGFGANGTGSFTESPRAVLHTIYNNAIGAPVASMAYTWDAR
ncbi:hypothetical protein OTK49_02990 [Vibrio coralliirubri]|uniref:hypothetical protein n=1 Tax=Vibrio coralliirubri TaxID=1516159 RepID=UPI0022836D53|nr:hypothetical protein [Vibrio coralliirubri]MCY9861481.1 hypothetical protein [Vibrio coralliirubri]